MNKCYKVFVLSDKRTVSNELASFLTEYKEYDLRFIPSEMNLFDVLQLDPDIVIMDSRLQKVVKCYEWNEAA